MRPEMRTMSFSVSMAGSTQVVVGKKLIGDLQDSEIAQGFSWSCPIPRNRLWGS